MVLLIFYSENIINTSKHSLVKHRAVLFWSCRLLTYCLLYATLNEDVLKAKTNILKYYTNNMFLLFGVIG